MGKGHRSQQWGTLCSEARPWEVGAVPAGSSFGPEGQFITQQTEIFLRDGTAASELPQPLLTHSHHQKVQLCLVMGLQRLAHPAWLGQTDSDTAQAPLLSP